MRMTDAPRDTLAGFLGWAVRASRIEAGWTQAELARRVGWTQSAISRFERGRIEHVDLEQLARLLDELGIRLRLDRDTLGLANRRDQRDIIHARLAGYVGRRLGRAGWTVRHEVEVGEGRGRGWIDLLAYREGDRSLLCVEIKGDLDDLGRVQRTLGWYQREAWTAARAIGWRPARVTSAVVALRSAANDRTCQANSELIRQVFTGSASALQAWLDSATAPLPAPVIAFADPRSRSRSWLLGSNPPGRRRPPAFRDAAEARARVGSAGG